LMMPDFSFAPFGYLTNMIEVNMSGAASVPRGWPQEREAIYASGRRTPFAQKRRALFWRGGETHPQRRVYSSAIVKQNVTMPSELGVDVHLCGSHCSLTAGLAPEAWCKYQQLLSLPGHSFAVGFKYTLLCSSVVVRGAHSDVACESTKHQCPRVYEQFWHAGLRTGEHFVASRSVGDLPGVVQAADRNPSAARIAANSADYAYHVLDPEFISEYWHALLKGYAALFDWSATDGDSPTEVCNRPHRKAPLAPEERVCLRGPTGKCALQLLGEASDDGFQPIPSASAMAAECNSTAGMFRLYRRFARVTPLRFTGGDNVSNAADKALQSFLAGSNSRRDAG